jgi:ribosome-associated translation inhibitor RaiA
VTGADTFVVVDKAAAKLEQQLEKAKTKVMRRRTNDAAQRSVERRKAASTRLVPADGPRQLPKAV